MGNQEEATQPIKVLVASSNSSLRAILCWSLTHDSRFEVVQALDSDAAVDCRSGFNVAVIDLAIHGLGALGVIGRLRHRKPAPATVVVAYTDAVYLRHAVAAEGAVDYLVMPDDLDELPDRLLAVNRAVTPLPIPG